MLTPKSTTPPPAASPAASSRTPADYSSLLTLAEWDDFDPVQFDRAMARTRAWAAEAAAKKAAETAPTP